jgi:5-methylcytosine-specific restriction endonuclease McrA
MYENTKSMARVAAELGCSIGNVFNVLKRNGVQTSLKGRTLPEAQRLKVIKTLKHGQMLGKTHSKQTKDRMSAMRKGELNANYKGGRTAEIRKLRRTRDYVKWAETVKRKAGNKCVECGANKSLCAHHIVPIKDDRAKIFDIDNGVCLCRDCHKKAHNAKGGHWKWEKLA